jgi:hypothetical protein
MHNTHRQDQHSHHCLMHCPVGAHAMHVIRSHNEPAVRQRVQGAARAPPQLPAAQAVMAALCASHGGTVQHNPPAVSKQQRRPC